MGDRSKIEWTDATWNPITGCSPVSEGCENCYAKREAEGRLRGRCGYDKDEPFKVTLHPDKLDQPLRWTKPRRIFVCSMGDLFHEDVPRAWIEDVFNVILECRQHTFLILTKRPDRMRLLMKSIEAGSACNFWVGDESGADWVTQSFAETLPHVWLGVTAENQARADERIPVLLDTPAAVRFVSVEPMLGPVDLALTRSDRKQYILGETKHFPGVEYSREKSLIDWVICGGETGQNARPMHPDWGRNLRDQCTAVKVPFFFKQWGEWAPVYDRDKEDPDCRNCDLVVSRSPKGRWMNLTGGHGFHGERVVRIDRLGKKAAGRLLDGRTWDEYPVSGEGA